MRIETQVKRFFDEEPGSGAAPATTPPAATQPATPATPAAPAAPVTPAPVTTTDEGPIDLSLLSEEVLTAAEQATDEATRKKILETGVVPPAPKKEGEGGGDDAAAQAAAAEAARKKEFPYGGNKFKTTEELAWGVINTGKPLKYSGKWEELDPLGAINEARRTGDWTKVNEIYTQLDAAIASGAPSNAAGSQTPETGNAGHSNEAALQEQQRMAAAVFEATREDVMSTQTIRDLLADGVTIPDGFLLDQTVTEEFMRDLRRRDSVSYFELKTQIPQLFQTRVKEAQDHLTAQKESVTHNDRIKSAEVEKIKAYAKKIELPLKDEDLNAFVAKQLANANAFEQRSGVKFLREGSFFDQWYLTNREKIEEQIGLVKERNGRTQAIDDINRNGKRQPSTISNAGLPGDQAARREKADTLDLTDPAVLGSLSDAELDELDKHPEKREALMPK